MAVDALDDVAPGSDYLEKEEDPSGWADRESLCRTWSYFFVVNGMFSPCLYRGEYNIYGMFYKYFKQIKDISMTNISDEKSHIK